MKNEEILDLQWITVNLENPKLCPICKARAGKTPKEIEELKDNYPIKIPCHDGCRCCWAPKVPSWDELMAPGYKPVKQKGKK